MSTGRKREVIELVRRSPVSKRVTLAELGMASSTYYRWQRRLRTEGEAGLVDRKPEPQSVWNRLRPAERDAIVREALRQPDRSPRELACWLTDHAGFTVSESTVYRVMKRHGLIPAVRPETFPAGKEYHIKTTRINEQWQSDASYFFVVGWGFYYFISVLDDYSRKILAWALKRDMTSGSISEVIEQAIAWTGVKEVPVEDRTRLLTDNGSSYVSKAFDLYLDMHGIRHIRCAPYHPQTNGKIERFHQSMKTRLNLLVYTSPESLERAMEEFIQFYNHERYHEGVGNVTPADVYYGRREDILKRRKEQKEQTILQRLEYNLGRCLPSIQG